GFRISARRRSKHGSGTSGRRSTGRRPRRSATSSSGKAWSRRAVDVAERLRKARWWRRRARPTRNGRSTSKAGSGAATGSAAIRCHCNEQRPHEALDQKPPIKLWQPPSRTWPVRLDDPWYDADHEVRRVRPTGEIKWRGDYVFVGEALAGECVGLSEHDSGGH